MRNKLLTIYRDVAMERYSLPTSIRSFLERALFFILFPEFRKDLNMKGFLSWCGFSFIAYLVFAMTVNNYVLSNDAESSEQKLKAAYKNIEFLNSNAKSFLYNEAIDSLKTSAEYLRFEIFKKTGIAVPEKVSREHLLAMSQLSRKNQIPLSIYLRLVKQESGFDSSIVNPASGAFGYMQVLPSTFKHIAGVLSLAGGHTAINNLMCGTEYLKNEYAFWIKRKNPREAWEMSLACYTLGDSLPRVINKVPPGVLNYVNNIMKGYNENENNQNISRD